MNLLSEGLGWRLKEHAYVYFTEKTRVYVRCFWVRGTCAGPFCVRPATSSIWRNNVFFGWFCEECTQEMILGWKIVPVTPDEYNEEK